MLVVLLVHNMNTNNKEDFNKNRIIRTVTRRTVARHWPPMQCTYIPISICRVIAKSERGIKVHCIGGQWLVFVLFMHGSPNYNVFVKHFSWLFALFLTTLHGMCHLYTVTIVTWFEQRWRDAIVHGPVLCNGLWWRNENTRSTP